MLTGPAPEVLNELSQRWAITLGAPFERNGEISAWVAPATRADGRAAVLKIGTPHYEGVHEADGLRFWNGDGTVRLLESDETLGALLLERCEPGTSLRTLPEPWQDMVIAGLLQRVWRSPAAGHAFRPLAEMLALWESEAATTRQVWPDPGLVTAGLALFRELSRAGPGDRLLATDLHAGNVLRAAREPWLAIDPKPFVGDPAYDATQHLLNCRGRLLSNAGDTVRRLADLLEVSHARVGRWTFARLAVEASDASHQDAAILARALEG
jgi:streptomycin 6-kinase